MIDLAQESDAALIRRVCDGDAEVFAELIRRYHVKVYQLCYGMLGTKDRAEDAAQDVFVRAYKRLSTFRGEAAFSTWLYRLTHNLCLDHLRSRSRHRVESWDAMLENQGERVELLLQSPTPRESPADDLRDVIHSVLSELKPEYRTVLTLREMQGLTYDEMAKTLNVSIDSIKARLRRARQQLAGKLRHHVDEAAV